MDNMLVVHRSQQFHLVDELALFFPRHTLQRYVTPCDIASLNGIKG